MIACEFSIRHRFIKRGFALSSFLLISLIVCADSVAQESAAPIAGEPTVVVDQPAAQSENAATEVKVDSGNDTATNNATQVNQPAAANDSGPADAPLVGAEPDEATVKDWLSVVVDNSLGLQNREMPAYRYYVNKVNHLSYEDLKQGAVVSPPFKYFHREAVKHRGENVDIDVNIRRIEKVAITDSEKFEVKHLYEIWGWNEQSQAWLYVFVTPELPQGMEEGQHVSYHARFAGYFLKLQGYRAANAAKGKDSLVAPLLIGKFSANIPVVTSKMPFGMGQIFLLIFLLVLIVFFRFTRIAGFFGTSSIFPTRLKDDVEKPTDKENLEWIGSAIDPAYSADAGKLDREHK